MRNYLTILVCITFAVNLLSEIYRFCELVRILFGYTCKLLHVDLSTGRITKNDLTNETIRNFIGGRGIGAKILFDELESRIDPFSPENPCIFTTGPFTGIIPGCPKIVAVTKSPLTGIYGCSIGGSFFGAEMKSAGYDGIVIKGKAASPAYIMVTADGVEIRDARHLWGMATDELDNVIKKELGEKVRTICIGPAGEKLVRFACAISDKRAFGRKGIGAVMGSKNLKAVSVLGQKRLEEAMEIYNADSLKESIRGVLRWDVMTKKNPKLESRHKYGTPELVDFVNEIGVFPTRNFLKAVFEGADKINGQTLVSKYVEKNVACFTCPVACVKLSKVQTGQYKGATTEGPEYETLYAFGANCENDNLESIIAADMLCDSLGLDTISTGCVIGFAMECYERKLITRKDTGIELTFGNHEAMVEMIKKIAYREGFGDVLAEGVRRVSERIEKSGRFAVHVKGLELPGWDARGSIGQGLAYATACTGGDHTKAATVGTEIGEGYDRYSPIGKAELVKKMQDKNAVFDSLSICNNGPNRVLDLKICSRLLADITGWDVNEDELWMTGERINNLERLINVREGIGRKDDTLPERLFKDPVPEGPAKGHCVGTGDFNVMLDEYYRLRGWNSQGIPTKEKLEVLGINV